MTEATPSLENTTFSTFLKFYCFTATAPFSGRGVLRQSNWVAQASERYASKHRAICAGVFFSSASGGS